MPEDDYYLICPHCGEETGIDPALVHLSECTFCPSCKEQIFFDEDGNVIDE